MAEQLNLIQKLAKIREIADVVAKSKKGYNYKYSDITEILAKIRGGMAKQRVSLIPSIVSGTMEVAPVTTVNTKSDRAGNTYDQTATEMLFKAEMVFKWVNDDNPDDFIEVPWIVTGSQADPSQAMGSALTYCTRYFLTNYFQIAQTDNDVDSYRSKQKEAEHAEDIAIAEGIISTVDSLVKSFVSVHVDKRDDLVKLVSKYAKGGNYNLIKEPTLASKLLEEVQKFIKGE